MIFNFGKYKYQELSYVVENDLDYALWVLRSVNKLEKDDLCVLKKLTQEKLFSMVYSRYQKIIDKTRTVNFLDLVSFGPLRIN